MNGLLLAHKNIKLISNRGLMGRTAAMLSTIPLTYALKMKLDVNRIKFQETRADDFALSKAKDPVSIENAIFLFERIAHFERNIIKDLVAKNGIKLTDKTADIAVSLLYIATPHLEPKARIAKLRKAADDLRDKQAKSMKDTF